MQFSSIQVQEHRCDIDDFGYSRNDYVRMVPFEINRSPPFSISTSPSHIPPLSPVKKSSWNRLSFGKFSSQPIRVSILKLDGSSFDVIVTKKATVAKLKKTVESAFSHLPIQDGNISWSHVWGHFCLCFEHMKLLRDRDSIKSYGIQNGSQLQFVRHTPIYEIAGERLLAYGSDEPEGSSSKSDWHNSSNHQNVVRIEVNEGYGDFGGNAKSRSSWGSKTRHISPRRLGNGPKRYECGYEYSLNQFIGFTGGFGGFTYPTRYCLK